MDKGVDELGLIGWGIVLVVVYAIAPFLYLVDLVKGGGK